jgi:hypothetical protein
MPVNIKKVLENAKVTQSSVTKSPAVDTTKYCTIKQAAVLLDRSIYRTRQLYWDGHFPSSVKPEKEVYLLKTEVLAWKKVMDGRTVKNDTLDDFRMGKRVIFSCETVNLLITQDTSLDIELRHTIVNILAGYIKEGQSMIKEK